MTHISARSARLAGMGAMLLSVAIFSAMDACLKGLAAHYPSPQVAALRGLSSLPIVLVWSLWAGGVRPLFRVRWLLHLVRGVLSVVMLITFSYGVKTLALSETYAIFFIAPLLVTIFSLVLLGERVLGAQWWAIAIGFVGVLVALHPRGAGFASAGGLAVLVCAVCYSLSIVMMKVLTRSDSVFAMTFWVTAMLAIGATAIALPGWVPILATDWWLIAMVALTGSVAQYLITRAFQLAPAASVAPLEYTALAWGLLLDLSIWGAAPALRTLAGGVIVIVSGLILLRHESRAMQTIPVATPSTPPAPSST
jgi:drug/metabolite transporter (DMT)-like permease